MDPKLTALHGSLRDQRGHVLGILDGLDDEGCGGRCSRPAWTCLGLVQHLDDLRHVLLHVIAETACHAGHLDALRELIDGRQWMVLTD